MASIVIALIRSKLLRWGLLVVGLCSLGWSVLPGWVELPPSLTQMQQPGVAYVAADGTPLRHLLNEEGQRVAVPAGFDELPDDLVNATLAAEDKRFFSHSGVDVLATLRAMVSNVRAARVTSGGSTITQQLIKISKPKEPRTLRRKLIEALQARRLEREWTKQQIFAAYVNRVSYGNLFTGCVAAASGYFDKPLSDLSAAECAYLASLPQAPGRLNPFRDSEHVMPRQQWVIRRMHDLAMLDREAYDVAKAQRIRLQRFHGGFAAPHAIGLIDEPKSPVVRTTIDAPLQHRIETIVATRLEGLRMKHVDNAAVVVIENATGSVRALVGSRDFFAPDGGQINGAWVPHSPGSALKPFTYALAFERGATPASIVPDLEVEYQTPTGLYRPENYDHRHCGPMTYRNALGNSLNISAVRVLQSVGGAASLQTLLQRAGLTTLTESPEHYGLGLTIGNAPVRLIELANAYAAIARMGEWQPWSLLVDSPPAEPVRVMSARSAFWLADVLSDNQARVLTFGTHSALRLPFRVAAKTGTSTSYRDNWTLGFTPSYTVGVWAGNFEGQPMEDVTGVTGAGPIFRDVFLVLNDRQRQTWYADPPDAVRVRIDPRLGKRVPTQGPPSRMSVGEIFFGNDLPNIATARDYDSQGRALLPPMYAKWVASTDNWLSNLVACEGDAAPDELRIMSPTDGLVIRLDPDLPAGDRLLLRANIEPVTWQSATLTIQRRGSETFALLVKGEHEITALRAGSKTVRARVRVE